MAFADITNVQIEKHCARTQSSRIAPELDIITCEYPPVLGGVADYTLKVVEGLQKQGFTTRVWTVGDESGSAATISPVMRTFGRFGIKDIVNKIACWAPHEAGAYCSSGSQ